MTPVDVLRAARETLSSPERWTKGSAGKNALGQKIASYSTDAVCWCLFGAVARTEAPWQEQHDALTLLCDAIGGPVVGFNDAKATTHADVVRVLDTAIKLGDIGQGT